MAADRNAQFERYRKPTSRDQFLATMERVVPWGKLREVIEPRYPKPGNGRPPMSLQSMLHLDFVQHWFNLAKTFLLVRVASAMRRCLGAEAMRGTRSFAR